MYQANMLLEIELRKEQRFWRDQEIARLIWLAKRSEAKNDTTATENGILNWIRYMRFR
jgi:hypothetical protein